LGPNGGFNITIHLFSNAFEDIDEELRTHLALQAQWHVVPKLIAPVYSGADCCPKLKSVGFN
jgi:hypothetical protein